MELRLELYPELLPQQKLKVSPRLIAANQILELSSQELQQTIANELADNPALEQVEIPTCEICGSELSGGACPGCGGRVGAAELARLDSLGDYDGRDRQAGDTGDDEAYDPLTRVASEQTLAERLLGDLGTLLPASELPIAEYLVGSLDDRGYLSGGVDEVAVQLGVEVQRVRSVLSVLQSLEPIGVGASNLRECLLIQLDHLERRGLRQPHARQIVEIFLTELGEHKFNRIAQELKISPEAVGAVWEFVKSKLNPHPAHGFSATNARDRDTRQMYLRPDVVISRAHEGLEVEVVESRRFMLQINPFYSRLQRGLSGEDGELSADERRHVQEYIGRARLFISSVDQRRQTLFNITRCLAERQREFLVRGVRHLKPLSRAAVAAELGVHESTVSRATAGKYVMTPSGEVIPYAHFFTPSLSIKDIIKELIDHESKPLTDSEIVNLLRDRGITIARRTVAKYRLKLAILPSELR